MPSLRRALALGCDVIETDVRRRADGVLVLQHDDGNVPGAVPLVDALEVIAESSASVNLDIKEGGVGPDLVRAVQATNMCGRTTCTGGGWDALVGIRRLEPGIRIGLTIPPRGGTWAPPGLRRLLLRRTRRLWALAVPGILERHSADLITAHHLVVDRGFVDAVHGAGAELWCWTVDASRELARLTRLGVDGICSDRPESHGLSRRAA